MAKLLSEATTCNLAWSVREYWLHNDSVLTPRDAISPALYGHFTFKPYELSTDGSADREAILAEVTSQLHACMGGEDNFEAELSRRRDAAGLSGDEAQMQLVLLSTPS